MTTNLIKQTGFIPEEMMPQTQDESLKILEIYPKQFYRTLQVTEIKDVFKPIYPSMALVRKVIGVMSARAIMVQIITDVALFFNTGQNMNQDQVAELTDIILSDYYYLNIADFKLCFNNGKKGRYGKVFRVDGGVILEWLEKYVNDRLNEADEINYQQHQSTKGDKKLSGVDELYKKFDKK